MLVHQQKNKQTKKHIRWKCENTLQRAAVSDCLPFYPRGTWAQCRCWRPSGFFSAGDPARTASDGGQRKQAERQVSRVPRQSFSRESTTFQIGHKVFLYFFPIAPVTAAGTNLGYKFFFLKSNIPRNWNQLLYWRGYKWYFWNLLRNPTEYFLLKHMNSFAK